MNQGTEIILVEDNKSDADLTVRALRKNNLANRILHLTDGQQALDYFFPEEPIAATGKPNFPKVIFLDLKMPKVSGIEVLRRIKADDRTKLIPVVVLTSSKEDPDIKECYQLGVNSYVVKPLVFDEFVKVISHLGLYWMVMNQTKE